MCVTGGRPASEGRGGVGGREAKRKEEGGAVRAPCRCLPLSRKKERRARIGTEKRTFLAWLRRAYLIVFPNSSIRAEPIVSFDKDTNPQPDNGAPKVSRASSSGSLDGSLGQVGKEASTEAHTRASQPADYFSFYLFFPTLSLTGSHPSLLPALTPPSSSTPTQRFLVRSPPPTPPPYPWPPRWSCSSGTARTTTWF